MDWDDEDFSAELNVSELVHEGNHHNGDCVWCDGYSYESGWWNEICPARVKMEQKQILYTPKAIKAHIKELEKQLKQAIKRAEKLKKGGKR
jgi:hypothetical protein